MKKNLKLLAFAILSIGAFTVAMQREERVGADTPEDYASIHRDELVREWLIWRDEDPNMAKRARIPSSTLYLWAAAKINTPAAKEWYKNYLGMNPIVSEPVIFTPGQLELYEWAKHPQ